MPRTNAERGEQASAGRKTYQQFCPLASALDEIGDRWTLLIIREMLFLGPRRFKDLSEALPGLAPNLLTTRLRFLEDAGLVERAELPPPAGSSVYRLTSEGEALHESIVALMRWGLGRMPGPTRHTAIRPEFPRLALEAAFVSEASRGIEAIYELTLDDVVLSVHVEDGVLRIEDGPAAGASLRLRLPMLVFARIAVRQTDPVEAFTTGTLEVDGEPSAIEEFLRVFGRFGPLVE